MVMRTSQWLVAGGIAAIGTAIGVPTARLYRNGMSGYDGNHGILPCPPFAIENVLSPDALQCWLDAPHGRWRLLRQVSVNGAVVVQTSATSLADSQAIAELFIARRADDVSEVVVYVEQQRNAQPAMTRRVQWRRQGGIQTLDFPSRR